MVIQKLLNDDQMRRYSYFPTIKDPMILEHTLLRIINDLYRENGQAMENNFDINNPRIANTYFTYISTSNLSIGGQLPMSYIYNDMIRHIQSKNTKSNFTMTLESIYLELDEKDYLAQAAKMYLIYEIVSSYIVENYAISYNYMISNANCIMIAYVPKGRGMMAYILSTGFDPRGMAKWYSTSDNLNDPNALPAIRHKSLTTIVGTYESHYGIAIGPVSFECSDGRTREAIDNCVREVEQSCINNLRKKSKFDTEVKYGNYNIDYQMLDMYDRAVPACMGVTPKGVAIPRFNHEGNYKEDFRLMEKQQDLVKVQAKRNK